ncbi:FmdE family protein [Thermovenabulum gondwanense]|uniref:Formylmethanofuran dehydrogenase subunit E domain-containing protein n=1 Tax=Thermovenabulum gondwanense TaxID=520767 RepID=A0A162N0S3_9FIRM|nr:FmdE family protein [Thermovenabulum gondwanense]KYO68644.1 hypothetical protein ATZ99_01530 [Thermovenabulum gondwanense]
MNKELWQKCVDFHGHECPGLAIGIRASEAAIKKLNLTFSKDEEVVCITENDACGVDAVQVITGCTVGKGNLIFRNTGKQAFTFFRRDTKEGIRIVLKPTDKEMTREEKMKYLLNAPLEDIFEFKKPHYDIPGKAKIFRSVKCENCGEMAAENKIRLMEGKKVCMDCYEDYCRGWN